MCQQRPAWDAPCAWGYAGPQHGHGHGLAVGCCALGRGAEPVAAPQAPVVLGRGMWRHNPSLCVPSAEHPPPGSFSPERTLS